MAEFVDEVSNPLGYAFRVYERRSTPTDVPTDLFSDIDNFPQKVSNGKVIGDTHQYDNPYTARPQTVTLGETEVRDPNSYEDADSFTGTAAHDYVYGRKSKPGDESYNGMPVYKDAHGSIYHKGLSTIGLPDNKLSLTSFDDIGPTVYPAFVTPDRLEELVNDKNYGVRYAPQLLDEYLPSPYQQGTDFDETDFRQKVKEYAEANGVVPVYVADFDRARAYPADIFDSSTLPAFESNTNKDPAAAEFMRLLHKQDYNGIRRMMAAGANGFDNSSSNAFKRMSDGLAAQDERTFNDNLSLLNLSQTLHDMYTKQLFNDPVLQYTSAAEMGNDVNRKDANKIRNVLSKGLYGQEHTTHVPLDHIPADIDAHRWRMLLRLMEDVMENSSINPPAKIKKLPDEDYLEAAIRTYDDLVSDNQLWPVPVLVSTSADDLYKNEDVIRGDLAGQRDATSELVTKKFTPVREIPIKELRHLFSDANNSWTVPYLRVPDTQYWLPTVPDKEWYAEQKRIDNSLGDRLREIAGIQDGEIVWSDERLKTKLSSNVVNALTQGGNAWR